MTRISRSHTGCAVIREHTTGARCNMLLLYYILCIIINKRHCTECIIRTVCADRAVFELETHNRNMIIRTERQRQPDDDDLFFPSVGGTKTDSYIILYTVNTHTHKINMKRRALFKFVLLCLLYYLYVQGTDDGRLDGGCEIPTIHDDDDDNIIIIII